MAGAIKEQINPFNDRVAAWYFDLSQPEIVEWSQDEVFEMERRKGEDLQVRFLRVSKEGTDDYVYRVPLPEWIYDRRHVSSVQALFE